jgi:DNA-binding response OmpR family regulator
MNAIRPLSNRRVLVVEDQYYLATDICQWLEAAGATVIGPAADAAQACVLIRDAAPDSAVVDINLGDGPAFNVASELAERRVPFLFATGYDQAAIPAFFQDAARLEKPFHSKDLISAVELLVPERAPGSV